MFNAQINAEEVAEPLGDGLFVIQPKPGKGYRFGKDSVALACFASEYVGGLSRVLDLCSGCGVVGMILNIKTGANVLGVEYSAALCGMAERAARGNGMNGIRFVCGDVRDVRSFCAPSDRFDAVVCNPPYYKSNSKGASVAPEANSEITVEFKDIANAARRVLKPLGEFIIVHTAARLDEVLETCRENKLMPKNLVVNKNGRTFLLRCVLGAKSGLAVQIKEFECYTS